MATIKPLQKKIQTTQETDASPQRQASTIMGSLEKPVEVDVFQKLLIKPYFEWLSGLAGVVQERGTYWCLFGKLYSKEFYGLVPNDDNRSIDGQQMRKTFIDEYMPFDDDTVAIDGPCRVLEMLIALAIRCEVHVMMDPEKGNRTKQWFWIMINNLGFGDFTDLEYSNQISTNIDENLDILLERKYDTDGLGGLFPLQHPFGDQTEVEIWYQLNQYLIENY